MTTTNVHIMQYTIFVFYTCSVYSIYVLNIMYHYIPDLLMPVYLIRSALMLIY